MYAPARVGVTLGCAADARRRIQRDVTRSGGRKSRCPLCGAKDVSEPRGDERYCRDCWDKKIAVEEIVAREFALKRYIRAHSAEKYLIYHSTIKRPCGQLIVVDDGYDLFLTMVLYPTFAWDEPAYHLEGDPEGRSFAEILVDVVATEVIEPWGGGKWHLEIFRSADGRTRGLERRDVTLYNRAGPGAVCLRIHPSSPREDSMFRHHRALLALTFALVVFGGVSATFAQEAAAQAPPKAVWINPISGVADIHTPNRSSNATRTSLSRRLRSRTCRPALSPA